MNSTMFFLGTGCFEGMFTCKRWQPAILAASQEDSISTVGTSQGGTGQTTEAANNSSPGCG